MDVQLVKELCGEEMVVFVLKRKERVSVKYLKYTQNSKLYGTTWVWLFVFH